MEKSLIHTNTQNYEKNLKTTRRAILTTKNPFSAIDGKAYLKYRPKYPESLIKDVIVLLGEKKNPKIIDLATGNGQVATQLADFGYSIIAIDSSEQQIKNNKQHQSVVYRLATAEDTKLEKESVDLITIGSGLHRFDFNNFFLEAYRILKPGGIISAFSYNIGQHVECKNKKTEKYFEDNFKLRYNYGMQEPLRKYVCDDMYKTIPYPENKFIKIDYKLYKEEKIMTVRDYIEMVKTTGAVSGKGGYNERHNKDLGKQMYEDLKNILDENIIYKQDIFHVVRRKNYS